MSNKIIYTINVFASGICMAVAFAFAQRGDWTSASIVTVLATINAAVAGARFDDL